MKSSFHSLTPFWPYPSAANSEDSTEFSSSAPKLASRNSTLYFRLDYSTTWLLLSPKSSQSHIATDGQSVSQSVSLGVEPHVGLMTRYLLLFDSYGLVFCGVLGCTVVTWSRLLCPFITPWHGPRIKHSLSTVKEACLLARYLTVDVLLLHSYASRECVYRVVA
jgi:hypothetical protein